MRAHADDLRAEVDNDSLVDAIAADWRSAPVTEISARSRALCEHAVKLTLTPAAVGSRDIEALHAAGCSDEGVTDLTNVVSLFAYFNRVADGLGIDAEPDWD